MLEFRTVYDTYKSRGAECHHPLGRLTVVGSLVEVFPPGSYATLTIRCPTINAGPGAHIGSAWYIMEGRPPKTGSTVPWLCGCVRAEQVQAEVGRTLIVRENEPAILDGNRGLIWPESFETINKDDLDNLDNIF